MIDRDGSAQPTRIRKPGPSVRPAGEQLLTGNRAVTVGPLPLEPTGSTCATAPLVESPSSSGTEMYRSPVRSTHSGCSSPPVTVFLNGKPDWPGANVIFALTCLGGVGVIKLRNGGSSA